MKRFENYGMENQKFSHQFMDPLAQIFYPNHSIHKHEANPNANDHTAAPEIHNQT